MITSGTIQPQVRHTSQGRPPFIALLILSVTLIFLCRETQTSIAFLDYPSNLMCTVVFVVKLTCMGLIRAPEEEYDLEMKRILSPASNCWRSVGIYRLLMAAFLPSFLPYTISTEAYKSKGTAWLYHRHTILASFYVLVSTASVSSHSTACQTQMRSLTHPHTHA